MCEEGVLVHKHLERQSSVFNVRNELKGPVFQAVNDGSEHSEGFRRKQTQTALMSLEKRRKPDGSTFPDFPFQPV